MYSLIQSSKVGPVYWFIYCIAVFKPKQTGYKFGSRSNWSVQFLLPYF